MAAGTLADEDPEAAWAHARAARARGGRIAVVRETVGLVAYRAGEWAEAIGELRAARRMGGGPGHLAVLADCERALGHPEKAIELARSEQAAALDEEATIELATVVAGARADLGQLDAGLAHLEQFGPDKLGHHPRLAYAYADLLDRAGRESDALTWFIRAANADADEDTDAQDRVEALAASVGAAVVPAAAAAVPENGTDQAADADADSESVGPEHAESEADESEADASGTDASGTDASGTDVSGTDASETGEAEVDGAGADEAGADQPAAPPAMFTEVEPERAPLPALSEDMTALLFSDEPPAGDR
ncbi:MAG: tetratricopeptide repeat protein [Nakamurella multipartita]